MLEQENFYRNNEYHVYCLLHPKTLNFKSEPLSENYRLILTTEWTVLIIVVPFRKMEYNRYWNFVGNFLLKTENFC